MGYVLFDEIASGGMASVHFGRLSGPVGFSRVVAIKRLHKHLAREDDFVTMFLDEARLAARIRHTNVIPTIDVVAGDEIFIVMEYIQGESLSRLIRAEKARGRTIPLNYAMAIMAGALHGLHAAHDATDERGQPLNIVHRDVSPQNVLVGLDGVPRVFDFGVAKAAGRLQNTRDGSLKGKIAYMSPEQLAGRDVSRRSDVYSAGVMMWELLAARRLFDGDNEASIIPKIMAAQIAPPSTVNPNVPKALDDITMTALSFDNARRYPSAKAMAQELERNGGLVSASELGDWVRELAHEAIEKRARRIHDIESRDISDVSSGAEMSGSFGSMSKTTIPPNSGMRGMATETTSPGTNPSHVSQMSGSGSRRMFADVSSNMGPPQQGQHAQQAPQQQSSPFPLIADNTPSIGSIQSIPPVQQPRTSGGYNMAPPELSTSGAMSMGEDQPKRRGGAVVLLALLALLLLAGGGFAVWKYAPRKTGFGGGGDPVPTQLPSAEPGVGASGSSGPSSSASAAGTGSVATTQPSATPSVTPAGTPSGAPSVTPSASVKVIPKWPPGGNNTGHVIVKPPLPKDDCDPPYVIDADGHKSYKRNCLGQ